MINYRRITTIFITASLIAWFGCHRIQTQAAELIDAQGRLSKNLVTLLQLTGIEHDGSLSQECFIHRLVSSLLRCTMLDTTQIRLVQFA